MMLVDDERLALVQLEKALRSIAEPFLETIEIVTLQNPVEAMELAERFKPQVAFLDIHMPELSGLQVAEQLQERFPHVNIVFLTAYDHYAIKAFELNAIDYLLKPLVKQRLEKTFQRLLLRSRPLQESQRAGQERQPKMLLNSRTILVGKPGQPPELPKWRTTKAQELFAYLLMRRGEAVHKSTILDLMLPELDKKRAMTQLYTVIYQIRQCLQALDLDVTISNVSIQESYILRLGENVTVESEQWERKITQARENLPAGYEAIAELLQEYDGGYLRDHDYLWAEHERERVRQLWLGQARQLASYLEEQRRMEEVLRLLEKIQETDPFHEAEGQAVLTLYDRLGQYDRVLSYYNYLESAFREELDLPIPAGLAAWMEQWRSRQ
ncbi:response regulator [Paenibacillus sp. CAU 1782]